MDRTARPFSTHTSRGHRFLALLSCGTCLALMVWILPACARNRAIERGPSFDIPGTPTVGRNLHVEPRGQTIPPPGLGVDLVGFELAEGRGLPNSQKSRSK